MKSQHALGALIESTIERNHWTQESVVERARTSGFRMSTQNLSRIKNSSVTTLVPEQVRALAAGLQLPVSVVLAATLESLGFTGEPLRQPGVEEAVKYDHRLSTRDRRILTAVVTELLADDDEKAGGEHDTSSASMNEAGDDAGNKVTPLNRQDQGRARRRPPAGLPMGMTGFLGADALRELGIDAARPGTPRHMPDATTGEESQETGGHDPA